ncbi:MAG: hypothetical protein GQ574_02160 [Crocinitomix sp.]|nr:hypothetical protein [Crocinitomix sp.]
MKSLRSTFIFLSFLFIANSATAQATIYMTADDFGKEETKTYKEVVLVKNSLILSSEDGSAEVYSLKEHKVWGYRNTFGEDYRIKNAGTALRIVEYGEICIYAPAREISTISQADKNTGRQENPYALTTTHSFSIGAEGKIIKFSNRRLLKALKGNAAVYQKFEKLMAAGSRELLLKVIEHNAASN